MTTWMLHLGGYDLKGIYSLEEYYARQLGAYYVAEWNIQVSMIEPEGVKTQAPSGASLGTRTVSDTDVYRAYCEIGKQGMADSYESSLDPDDVVNVIVEALEAD